MKSRPLQHKPKRTPPKDGIKVRKIGATWWGQRWIGALEHLSRDYLNRLGRGRAYARAGRVHDLAIVPGKVTARVTGSDAEPYEVTLRIAMLSPASWQKVIETMSRQALFGAELLAGRMPVSIDDAFRASGHSLFLSKQRELETDCSCPDWANPCKHVAAVHYVLGEAFDRDPFLLFELRGRTKQQVLGALRALRVGGEALLDELQQSRLKPQAGDTVTGVPIDGLDATNYERFAQPPPALHLQMTAPATPGALLRQLGPPPTWSEDAAPFAALLKQLTAGGVLAREWALQANDANSNN